MRVVIAGVAVGLLAAVVPGADAAARRVAVAPGSYAGANPQNGQPITFYVAVDRKHVQNVNIPIVLVDCLPAGTFPASDSLLIASAAINRRGAFSGKGSQTGVFDGSAARFTYAFSGRLRKATRSRPASASGTFSERITFNDGVARACTSRRRAWKATRDQQAPQRRHPPTAGSYAGANPQNGQPLRFYVAADRRHVQNISIPIVLVPCVPAGTFPADDHLGIASAQIKPDGSFAGAGSQRGLFAGSPATFSYHFRGNFEGPSLAGVGRASGSFRVDIAFNDGVPRHCTSNTRSWSVQRDSQPPQTRVPAAAGTYSGANPQNGQPLRFYVAPDHKRLLDISIPILLTPCAPTGVFPAGDHLDLAGTTIRPDGSFVASGSQNGIFAGAPATFAYAFSGVFEGTDSAGVARAGGAFREDITFSDGVVHHCTSNTQSWFARRDQQPPQTSPFPLAGTYQGANPQNGQPVTFDVAPGNHAVASISVPIVLVACAPAGAFPATDSITLTGASIKADGSFVATGSEVAVFAGSPATFTFRFAGNFEGVNASGRNRAGGTFREDITFNDGVVHHCTSNTQSWLATRTP